MTDPSATHDRQIERLMDRMRGPVGSLNGVLGRLQRLFASDSEMIDYGGSLHECCDTARHAASKILTEVALVRAGYGGEQNDATTDAGEAPTPE